MHNDQPGRDHPAHHDARTPPTTPGAMPLAPTKWPNVVGGISIAFGILGILTQGFSIVGAFFQKNILDATMPKGVAGNAGVTVSEVMKVTDKWTPVTMTLALVQTGCALLLLLAGIGMLRRRAASVPMHKYWAMIKIVVALIATVVGVMVQRQTMAAMQASNPAFALPPGMSTVMPVIGVVLGMLWFLAYPVFILTWLSKPVHKQEIASWNAHTSR